MTSSTQFSPSSTASCIALVYRPDSYLVTGIPSDSTYISSSGQVDGYYVVSEAISFPDLEFPVPPVRLVASELSRI